MNPFIPERIFYEAHSKNYPLGKELLEYYSSLSIPMEVIENHNNIEALRTQPNENFTKLKRYLIIGTRKTHKYTENHKVSDYLVPFTSSGCSAMCLYCYLVCHYNKCSYLRIFVNREEMLQKLIKKASSFDEEKVFEIGSNSDLVLENTITNNLVWTITEFLKQPKGILTFPTKFDMIDCLLPLQHQNRVIIRYSVNPSNIIQKTELKTSNLEERIAAINKLCNVGYSVGIIIAPIILVDDWEKLYDDLLQQLVSLLSPTAKKSIFFEAIFMTYSYVHQKINEAAFPNALQIYSKDQMIGRGNGKYRYKDPIRVKAEQFIEERIKYYFPNNTILYIA
ncbi:MAG: radical SAM protein [Coprobacillaceae bacterium]